MSRIDRPDRFAAEFLIRAAVTEAEQTGAAALRRRVFVSEQGSSRRMTAMRSTPWPCRWSP